MRPMRGSTQSRGAAVRGGPPGPPAAGIARIRLDLRDPTGEAYLAVDGESIGEFDDGCGAGSWCQTCRDEIEAEAAEWLRELATGEPMKTVIL